MNDPKVVPQQPNRVKRRRNKHSCDQCRSKKGKCDGNLPCYSCISNELNCTYSAPRKRGIPSGYLEKLEKTNEKLFLVLSTLASSIQGGETAVRDVVDHVDKIENSNNNDEIKMIYEDNKWILELLDIEDSIPSFRKKLSATTSDENQQQQHKHLNTSASALSDDNPEFVEFSSLGPSSGFDDSFTAKFERLQLTHSSFDSERWQDIIAPYSSKQMLENYFIHVHSAFPMVDQNFILNLTLDEVKKKSCKSCLYWTLVFIGFLYGMPGKYGDTKHSAQTVHDISISTLDCQQTVEGVQALLLQSLYFLGRGYWSNSWISIGNALHMAKGLDLNDKKTNNNNNILSRRTWKCCCLIDTIIAGRLGREPQLNDIDYFDDDEFLSTDEELELWSRIGNINGPCPGRAVSVFNAQCTLNRTANKFLTVTNRKDYPNYLSSSEKTLFLQTCVNELHNWFVTLPPEISFQHLFNPGFISPSILPHFGHLILGYLTVASVLIVAGATEVSPLLPSASGMINMCLNVVRNIHPYRKPLPDFEYFMTLCLTASMKLYIQENRNLNVADNDEFKSVIEYLREFSSMWGMSSVSYQYFTNLMNKDHQASEGYINSAIQYFFNVPEIDLSAAANNDTNTIERIETNVATTAPTTATTTSTTTTTNNNNRTADVFLK